jgi:hypothetical protein
MLAAVIAALLLQAAPPTPVDEPEPDAEPASKKEQWLADKGADPPQKRRPPAPPHAATPVVSLVNVWTHEILPVAPAQPPPSGEVDRFLRCHFTNRSTHMDGRLVPTVLRAAQRFRSSRVEIVSGYRSPKYNLMLRKKGRQVARDSEHPRGDAIDFRIPQVPTRTLLRFVRTLHMGGVGYYPESQFVHADTGRVRYWRGK